MKLIYSQLQLSQALIAARSQVRLLPITLNDLFWLKKGDSAYAEVTHVVPDGMPIVLYLKLLGYPAERLYGPDLFLQLTTHFRKKKHLFLGSKKMLIKLEAALALPKAKYLDLGFKAHGADLVTQALLKKIITFKPDFIWVGVGSPKQLQVMAKLSQHYQQGHIFCVGAALYFAIDPSLRAPTLMKQLSLEWLFRLVREPLRLWKRYLWYSPQGLFFLPQFIKKVRLP